jgi:hypothetical protein
MSFQFALTMFLRCSTPKSFVGLVHVDDPHRRLEHLPCPLEILDLEVALDALFEPVITIDRLEVGLQLLVEAVEELEQELVGVVVDVGARHEVHRSIGLNGCQLARPSSQTRALTSLAFAYGPGMTKTATPASCLR